MYLHHEVMADAIDTFDPYDRFGWVQEWRFAIADYLWWNLCRTVPEYRPGLFEPNPDDSYPYEILTEREYGPEELLYALAVLDRYREWLRLAGLDY